jgi:hypothetical protein
MWDHALRHVAKVYNLRKRRDNSNAVCSEPLTSLKKISVNPLTRMDVEAKKKYLRRYGCLTYWKPGVKKKDAHDDTGTALRARRIRGVHLGFSDNNSAWLVGTYDNGELKVYETRSATFFEDILVQNVQALDKPVSSLEEQLLARQNVGGMKGTVVGAGIPAVGTDAQYIPQGFEEVQWEPQEDCSDGDLANGSPICTISKE